MNYLIAVFRSRNQTTTMFHLCSRNGINCAIVNTPREAYVGCGISLKFQEGDLPKVKALLRQFGASSFAGLFRVSVRGKKSYVSRI